MFRAVRLDPCSDPDPIAQVLSRAIPLEAIDQPRLVRQVLSAPDFREEGSTLARLNGEPAGYCWAVAPKDSKEGFLVVLGVVPAARRASIGTLLLKRAEAFLRESGCTFCSVSGYPTAYFTPGVDEKEYAAGLQFLLTRGYEVSSRPLAMQRDLERLPALKKQPAADYEFRRSETSDAFDLIRFAARFSADWVRFVRTALDAISRGANSGRLQVALLEEKIVGFSHFEGDRFGPIGVDPAHEGKGVGSELMARSLQAMREGGSKRAWFLWTDDRTAERFYAPQGWKEWRRFSILRKDLSE